MKYEIGQEVWQATGDPFTNWIECPDCAGTGRIRCLLPDDTQVSIECEGCKRGYEGPFGRIQCYDWRAIAKLVTITGIEIDGGKTEWRTSDSYRVKEDRLFDNEADALAAAQIMATEHNQAERDRINHKEKPTRSWSWHVHYYRREIRDAESRIARAKAKLAVANLKAKSDKAAMTQDSRK